MANIRARPLHHASIVIGMINTQIVRADCRFVCSAEPVARILVPHHTCPTVSHIAGLTLICIIIIVIIMHEPLRI
jgi:hypothetical protein